MICRNCLRAASTARTSTSSIRQPRRFLHGTSSLANASPRSPTTTPTTSESKSKPSTTTTEKKHSLLVKSSIPAGQPLKGLNFFKNAQDPVALADDEYPAWLWTLLARQEKAGEGDAMGDLFSKSKRQRRLAARRLRKEQALHPELLIPKVPIYEQTIDLPAGDGSVQGAARAADARYELNKAMRDKRRATIKEANFLKAMN